jgi:hypothetical protein
MPLQATSGAASYDAFGGGVPAEPNYIESVFSTFLYTGNGSARSITNNIDLAGKGGLVWIKSRTSGAYSHCLYDTLRGANNVLSTDVNFAQQTYSGELTAFNSNGFNIGNSVAVNANAGNYVSWTFREQPKFFDVVTWTGNGANRTIAHNLGSVPGCMIVKRTDATADWAVYHRSSGEFVYYSLNSSSTFTVSGTVWNGTSPSSTVFSVGNNSVVNASGGTYVAYLFAHDAGGFGLTGTDNVISCGTYGGNGSTTGPVINLGYEPQWLMIKNVNSTGNWQIIDNMRGMPVGSADATLQANLSNAESSVDYVSPTATGFQVVSTSSEVNSASTAYIYIAIRRGPMKVPTTGTSVYSGVARTGTGAATTISGVGFSPDLIIGKPRTGFSVGTAQFDRLRGTSRYLAPSWTDAEITDTTMVTSFNMDGVSLGADTVQKYFNGSGGTYANWMFRRAPGFMDVVCYTGNGTETLNTPRQHPHNLGVIPELMILKIRADVPPSTYGGDQWYVQQIQPLDRLLALNTNAGGGGAGGKFLGPETTSSTLFMRRSAGDGSSTNGNGITYVAYLFASCPGVSKVFSYTGNGSSQTINCGFTGGARFVLIKRTDSTGDWYVWDTARGIVAGNDPHLSLNSTAAEVTSNDTIDPDSTGFVVNQVAATNVNVNAATYIGLAIA